MYMRIMVSEEILDEPVDGHPEFVVKEIDEDYNLAELGGKDVLAKGASVTQKLFRRQKSPTTWLLMSSSVTVDTSHGELGMGLRPPLLFELISSYTELMVLVFLARVFLGAITVTVGSGI